MSQLTDYLQLAFGWQLGENGWNTEMDSNFQKIDAAVDMLSVETLRFNFLNPGADGESNRIIIEEPSALEKIRIYSTVAPSAMTTFKLFGGEKELGDITLLPGEKSKSVEITGVDLIEGDSLFVKIAGTANGVVNAVVQVRMRRIYYQ